MNFCFHTTLKFLQCACLIFLFFLVPRHISLLTVCVSQFPWFSVFSTYFRSYSEHFSFSTFFSISCHIQVLQCFSLIFHVFQFSRPHQVLHCVFLIFYDFECFSIYFTSYILCFSFSKFFNFLAIFQVLQCAFLIFSLFSVPSHISHTTVCVSHFPLFWVFLPWSRSYSVHFSFSPFSVFLALFHLLQCVFLIFYDFLFSCHIPDPTVCISNFSRFWMCPTIF